MKKNGDLIHEEYVFRGNIWVKTVNILIICIFAFIVLLPDVINGEMFSLLLLTAVLIINIYSFYRQFKLQGIMRINHVGMQIITWNGFSSPKNVVLKEYQWDDIEKMELLLFFNSYPKLYIIMVNKNIEKIEMFPFITWYLNEKLFKKLVSQISLRKNIW